MRRAARHARWILLGASLAWARPAAADEPLQRPAIPQSPPMIHGGMILTGLGAFAVVTALLVLQRASQNAEPERTEQFRAGGIILGGGALCAAVGIPLWVIGAHPVRTGPLASTWLGVGLGGAGVRGTF